MRSFSRYWTLELHADIEEFRKAFRALVLEPTLGNQLIPNLSLDYRLGRDYYGNMRNETFDLYRRGGDSVIVFGKMSLGNSGVKLDLRVVRLSFFMHAGIFFQSIFAAVVVGLLLNATIITYIYAPPDEIVWRFLIGEWIILTIVMFFVIVRFNHWYIDWRIRDFNRVLRLIEQAAKTT